MKRIGMRVAAGIAGVMLMLIGMSIGLGMKNGVVHAQDGEALPEQTITVTGTAQKAARPSIAYVSVGVRTQANDMKQAQRDNAVQMDGVLAALKEMNIAEKDMQTDAFYVNPVYDQNTWTEVTGFEVIHTVQTKVTEIDRAGEIIDAAIEAGANNSHGIRFDITPQERERLYGEALKEAVASGEAKAKILAESIGKSIGEPVRVMEGGGVAEPYAGPRDMASTEAAADGTTISPGELQVGATVTLIYGTR